jgi:hypothetical protein
MYTTLEKIHVKQTREDLKDRITFAHWFNTYAVFDSDEKGRVILTHSDEHGEFGMDVDELLAAFDKEEADCVICCLPKLQWEKRPDVCKKLNLQYPDLDTEIYTNTRIQHIMYIGYGDWDEWCREMNIVDEEEEGGE